MKMKLSIIFAMMLCGSSCEKLVDHVYSIKIQNNTAEVIQFYASYTYPDTTIVNEKPRLKIAYPSSYSYWDSKEKWEDILPSDTISMYILSKDTVDKYSWDLIRSGNKILKRYDLSIKDLEKQNWTITYP
jgi:hypothetical protein